MNPGQIVEFVEGGRIIVAVCLEERRARVRVLTEYQREANLASSRLIHVSESRIALNQPREVLAQSLRERSVLREELASQIDVKTLWEILYDEGKDCCPSALAELAFGDRVDDDHISGLIRAMLADRVFFRFRVHGFRPNDPETVEKILTQRAREQERERQIETGSRWIMAIQKGKSTTPPEGWEEIVDLLKEYAIHGKGAPRARRCEELLRRAGMNHPLAPFRILIRLGIWSPDENLLIHRFGIRRSFPQPVMEESRHLLEGALTSPESDSSREDLRQLKAFTIDSPHTRDIDDALSLERISDGYRVGVHITDVSRRIPIGSQLDDEAAQRGTSLYLPEERIPMFPPEISEDLCSLMEKETRPAVSLFLEIDEQGEMVGHRFCLAWIKVDQRLSYEEADEIIKKAEEPVGWVLGIARAWREERIRRGALLLPLPEVAIRVEKDGEIVLEHRDRESPGQILVSEMMILANYLSAKKLRASRIPCVYRIQGEPRERIMEKHTRRLYLNYQQRKLLSRAEFQLDPSTHHGLGIEIYTTVTSPIRRYLDLVMQRQLVAAILEETPPYDSGDLQKMLMDSEEIMGQAIHVEQSRQRYWLLRYLESRKGEETSALVLGQIGSRIQLLLNDYMVEASVPAASYPGLQTPQQITVRLIRARPLEDELRVEPC